MRVLFDVDGAAAAHAHLEGVADRLEDISPAEAAVGNVMMRAMDQRWRSRGHGLWRKLDPDTVARKGHGRVLEDSGRSRRALTVKGAPGQRLESDPDEIRLGVGRSLFFLRFHHKGMSNPKRTIFSLRPTDVQQASQQLLEFFVQR